MKVMIYEGPKKLCIKEVEDYPIKEDEVRIQSMYSGISHGTEMSVYRGNAPFFRSKLDWNSRLFLQAQENDTWNYPIRSCDPGVWYMGYSNVGRIIETGTTVKGFKNGDIVYSNAPNQTQVIRKYDQIIKLPENIKPENGVFFTNMITTFNGILDTRIKLGDCVAVSGLGVLGQLAVQMVKLSGAFSVYGIDMYDKRLEAALKNGADAVFDPKKTKDIAMDIRKMSGNKGTDAVIEVSGSSKALNEAIRIAAPDTTVTALGWYQGQCSDLNLSEEFHHNRITLKCSQTVFIDPKLSHMWDHKRKERVCLDLLGKLKLDNLITHCIPYENAAEAYEMIDSKPGEIIQVVLVYK